MKTIIALLLASLVALPITHAQPARTPDLAEARRRYAEGEKLFYAARYAEAIRAYQEAYELSTRPLLLFNIGQAYRLMGDKPRALEFYRRYVEAEPNGKAIVEASAFVETLSREVEPPLPRPNVVEPAPAPTPKPVVVEPPPPKPAFVEAPATARPGRTLRIAGVVTGAAGLALAGAGTAFAVRASSLDARQDGLDAYDPDLVAAGNAANRNSLILFSVGSAALATGGVLYFLGARRDLALTPVPTEGGATLNVSGRW